MSASFPEDAFYDVVRRLAGSDSSERKRDAGTNRDHKGRGHDVVADAGFVI
jgi:hypothetical protein